MTDDAETMAAIVQDEYGTEPEAVLRLADIARPTAGADQVLVRVRAAAVDRGTWHLMTGRPYLVRLGFGIRRPKHRVPGLDLAGTVEAVGSDVTGFAPGDEVFGIGSGSCAEYACAPADKLVHKPASLSFSSAAAMSVSGLTALQGVRDQAKVQPGQHVLVVGASGGVGSYALQIAKAFGAEVTGVCHGSKADLVRSLGADHVIDYTTGDITDEGHRYDVILDIGGNRRIRDLRRALTRQGTLVIVGGEHGGRWLGGTDRQLRAMVLSPFVRQRLVAFISSEGAEDIRALLDLVESGQVTPALDRTYPLVEAAAAIRHLQEGRARGKVVVTV